MKRKSKGLLREFWDCFWNMSAEDNSDLVVLTAVGLVMFIVIMCASVAKGLW